MRRRYLWIGVLGLIVASVLLGGVQKAFTQPPKPKPALLISMER